MRDLVDRAYWASTACAAQSGPVLDTSGVHHVHRFVDEVLGKSFLEQVWAWLLFLVNSRYYVFIEDVPSLNGSREK